MVAEMGQTCPPPNMWPHVRLLHVIAVLFGVCSVALCGCHGLLAQPRLTPTSWLCNPLLRCAVSALCWCQAEGRAAAVPRHEKHTDALAGVDLGALDPARVRTNVAFRRNKAKVSTLVDSAGSCHIRRLPLSAC